MMMLSKIVMDLPACVETRDFSDRVAVLVLTGHCTLWQEIVLQKVAHNYHHLLMVARTYGGSTTVQRRLQSFDAHAQTVH